MGTSGRVDAKGDKLEAKLRFDHHTIKEINGLESQIMDALMKGNKLRHFTKLANDGDL